MRWLVTGAGGFVGGHLALGLAGAGHSVLAASRSIDKLRSLAAQHAAIAPITFDIEAVKDFNPEAAVDAILHCAAVSPATDTSEADMRRINVEGSAALAEWSARNGVRQFIHLSAMSVYGEAGGLVDELSPHIHPDAYGESKFLAEQAIETARGKLPAASLRLPGVLGRGAHRIWLASVLDHLSAGLDITYSNGDALFNNAVHVADLLDFAQLLATQAMPGHQQLVLGAGSALSIRDTLALMKTLLPSRSALLEQKAAKPAFHIDSRRAMAAGYAPMPLEAMLEKYVRESLGL